MLISEDSARGSQHAVDSDMAAIVLSPTIPPNGPPNGSATTVRKGFSTSFVRHAIYSKDAAMTSTQARAEELLQYHEERLSWRIYRTACRIRFGYLSFLVLMVLLMFSFTLLMEFFFAIFLPSARTFSTEYIVRSVILLALFPVILFFLSYLFEEAMRFFLDAINKHDGGLPNFRLALTVVIHYIRHRSEYNATEKAAEASDTGLGDEDEGETRRSRTTLFLSAKDDPFADDPNDEEEHDEDIKITRDWLDAHHKPATSNGEKSPARQRWKKAATTVMATNLLKKHQYDGPDVALSTFLMVDFICPVLFELITIVSLLFDLIATWSPYSSFLMYVQNGFWLTGFYVIVWMGCHFWSSRNPHMRRLVSHYRRSRRILLREVQNVAREKQADQLWLLVVGFRFYHHLGVFLNPLSWCRRSAASAGKDDKAETTTTNDETSLQLADGQTQVAIDVNEPAPSGFAAKVAIRVQNIRDTRATLRAKNPWHRLSLNVQAVILLVACMFAALISLWSFFLGWPFMGLALILLSNVIQRRFPQIFGATFRQFISAFVILSLIFFSATFAIGTFVTGGNFVLGEPTENTFKAAKIPSEDLPEPVSQTIEYPICRMQYNGLSALDFALIADAAYGSTPEIQYASLANRFNGTELANFTIVAHNDNKTEHQVWMEIAFPTLNTTVLAIRGTASAADALEDLHFWFGILIMQAVNVFIPFLRQLPQDFVVRLLSMKLISSVMPAPVYQPLLDHAVEVKKRVGDELIVTGHSLGGAMAAMIGAKIKAQAVSFSGPGLLYSRGRFDVNAQDVRDYVVTLKPQRDIVPRVDKLGGMVQELRCRHKSPMSCHSTNTHLCELYLACGDSRARSWEMNKECNDYKKIPEVTEDD